MTNTISKKYQDLLYLIRLTLRNEELHNDYKVETSARELLALAKFHSIDALLYNKAFLLFENGNSADRSALNDWSKFKDLVIKNHMMFKAEREKIFKKFREHNIWYYPLKGLQLNQYYPDPILRQMSDNDILFDKDKIPEVKEIMLARNFFSYNESKYDLIYHKIPIYNFEMHHALSVHKDFASYFEDTDSKLIKVNDFEKKLNENDHYLYLLSHELKHFKHGGAGLRHLIDLYYYMNFQGDHLNWDYINTILEDTKYLDHDNKRHVLNIRLFGDHFDEFLELTTTGDDLLRRYCLSGTYGTYAMKLNNFGNGKLAKVKYYADRIWPSKSWLNHNFPITKKYPLITPFVNVYRIVRGLFKPTAWNEAKIIMNVKDEN